MVDPLPALSHDELETLQAALDPLLDGFGASGSCLDDALAYLERLGVVRTGTENGAASGSALPVWIERWRAAGGNRQTLRLMVATLLVAATPPEASHGSDTAGLAGDGLATS